MKSWITSWARQPRVLAVLGFCLCVLFPHSLWAADEPVNAAGDWNIGDLLRAGGYVGYFIIALSVVMVALIIEHLISIRRSVLVPQELAEQVHQLLSQGQFQQAEELCRSNSSLLAYVLASGLAELGQGYQAVEKAMEDASLQQSSRLYRKIEWLSVFGNIAPMIGLFGTVWGMIQAFREFELKANPQVAELAPGIYEALVTTLLGLAVAVPAFLSFAFFRSRVDEFVAQSSLLAEHVFADLKRAMAARRKAERRGGAGAEAGISGDHPQPGVPVRRERMG